MLAALAQDVRYAVRLLARAPGFTVVSVATIALAVGANTAIFGVVHGVLLKALPFADPDRVVVLGHLPRSGDGQATLDSTTPGNLYDWTAAATGFEAIAGFSPTERIVTVGDSAERIQGGLVVGALFDVLKRDAAEGRALTLADDDPGAPPVVLLSARLARRLYGGAAAAGRALTINGTPHTVVGTMPADFAFFDYDYEYWVPARFDAAFRANRDQYFLAGLARLKPGVSREQADVQLNTVMDRIRRDWPQFTENVVAAVQPVKTVLLDGVERRLLVLQGAAVLVLLIACANLGNLLLARAATRRRGWRAARARRRPRPAVRQSSPRAWCWRPRAGWPDSRWAPGCARLVAHLPENLPRLGGVALDRPGALTPA